MVPGLFLVRPAWAVADTRRNLRRSTQQTQAEGRSDMMLSQLQACRKPAMRR